MTVTTTLPLRIVRFFVAGCLASRMAARNQRHTAEAANAFGWTPSLSLEENFGVAEGLCPDIAGFGANLDCDAVLQLHTCQSTGADTQFVLDLDTGEIRSVNYGPGCQALQDDTGGACVTIDGSINAGDKLRLDACRRQVYQSFVLVDGTIRAASNLDLCLAKAGGVEPAGPGSERTELALVECEAADPADVTWAMASGTPGGSSSSSSSTSSSNNNSDNNDSDNDATVTEGPTAVSLTDFPSGLPTTDEPTTDEPTGVDLTGVPSSVPTSDVPTTVEPVAPPTEPPTAFLTTTGAPTVDGSTGTVAPSTNPSSPPPTTAASGSPTAFVASPAPSEGSSNSDGGDDTSMEPSTSFVEPMAPPDTNDTLDGAAQAEPDPPETQPTEPSSGEDATEEDAATTTEETPTVIVIDPAESQTEGGSSSASWHTSTPSVFVAVLSGVCGGWLAAQAQ